MHVEKNMGESLIGTVLNVPGKTKDGYKARLDLVHYGLKPELHPKIEGNNTTLPIAGCTLTKEEKEKLCETLYNLRVPQGHCSNFSSLVSLKDRNLIRLKSHDYHMLMQQVLPIAIRSIMHPPTRVAITRWMYAFERFMKVVKGHVRNKSRPEGCIAEENVAEETIEFFSEFLKKMDIVGIPPDNHNTCGIHIGEDSSSITDGTPLSTAKSAEVSVELFRKAHFFVLQNTSVLLMYIKNGVKMDKLGYTLVELKRLGHKGDPFILASQAQLVFYVTDPLDQKMSIVFNMPPNNYRDTYEDVDEEFSTIVPQNDNILPRVDTLELQKENDYFRTDCHGIVIRTKGKAKPSS
uniref:DUF4218 domain-containing protein n=1 Tax=Lactuca sativa TaxID=4236 RepID=A0A9R1W9L2_LACSA|nr:hypothetical protein LSAT_V11C200065750 [Lactuca sativa]